MASSNPIGADKVEAESVDWLWKERIPRGMISIIAGKPDEGKGLVASKIAAEVSREGGHVLYSAIEDAFGLMTRPRLEAAGANLKNILLWRFQIPLMWEELQQHIIDQDIDLLVMDPFAAHLSGQISRQSDNIRTVITPLTDLIEQTNTAVIIVEHVLKRTPANGDARSAIGGSGSGIVAASRMAFLFGRDPADEDHRIMVNVKSNIRERPKALCFELDVTELDRVGDVPYLLMSDPPEIEFDPMRLLKADPLRGGRVGRPPDKRAAACEWLTNFLFGAWTTGLASITIGQKTWPAVKSGEGVNAGRVFEDAKQYGMTEKTLRRAAEDMDIVKDPVGGGRNCKWLLPDEIIDLLNGVIGVDKKDEESDSDQQLSDDDLEALLALNGDEMPPDGPVKADQS